MFQSARLKLTAWYLLIIMLISVIFSLIIYSGINNELRRYERFWEIRSERLEEGFVLPPPPRGTPVLDLATISAARTRLILIFVLIDSGIFATAGIAGYFLAGKTLRPIKTMLDEQNRFVADASHELRTPLTAMKTEIEVALREKNLSAVEAKKLLASNLEEVAKMQNLSNYLLSLNRYETDNLTKEKVELSEIAKQTMTKLNPLAKNKKISFVATLRPVTIFGNKDSLSELMTILIENAIKYSHDSSEIKINLSKVGTHAKFSVQDFGIGIQETDQSHIFKRFFRSESSRTKNQTDGYGLGLSIAKNIVDLHHGKIEVKSSLGQGATFTVII